MSELSPTARIILEDGTEFEGVPFGHESSCAGEVVAYIGQAGLPQVLTDPAMRGVLLVLSQPVAGASGIPNDATDTFGLAESLESGEIQVAGLAVADFSGEEARSDGNRGLSKWLKRHQVPAISGIDTRALIQRLASRGSMRGKILSSTARDVSFSSASQANQPAHVSVKRSVVYGSGPRKILLVDAGARNSVIRRLVTPDTTVIRVPCAHDYRKEQFDGIVIAGSPGDPTSCDKTASILAAALERKKPVFAVGQGAVILGMAAGASPYRMAMGHRGPGIPCVDLESGRCWITAQNHGYGIRDDSLPPDWYPTFLNNTDNTLEGFASEKGLFAGVLFQPEGNPGPRDTAWLYDRFLERVLSGGIQA